MEKKTWREGVNKHLVATSGGREGATRNNWLRDRWGPKGELPLWWALLAFPVVAYAVARAQHFPLFSLGTIGLAALYTALGFVLLNVIYNVGYNRGRHEVPVGSGDSGADQADKD